MKLSPSLVLDSLSDCYNFTKCQKISDSFCLKRPVFYESEAKPESGRIYIVYEDVPDFSESPCPQDCLFLGWASVPQIRRIPGSSLCLFPDSVPPLVLFNHLQRLFDRYENWDSRLHQLQTEEGSISQILDVSWPLFGNPLMVQNLDFSVISSTHMRFPSDDPERAEKDMELINTMKQDPLFNQVREVEDVFTFPDYVTGFRTFNLNIKKFGRTAFRITLVEQDRPLRSYDRGLLTHLGTYVKYALLHNVMQRPSGDKTLHNILLNMLSNRNADYMAVSRQLTACGWLAEHSYLCLLLTVTYIDRQNLTENAICDYVENVIPGSCAFVFHDNVVVYVNMDQFGGNTEDITEKLIYFIRDSFLKLSYSYRVTGHMDLRRQYLQAEAAHKIGSIKKPYLWIHSFSDAALPYIFQQACRKIPGSMLCHEKLPLLKKHDQEQGTEYMKTLKVYLENNRNAVQSAKELYIHRSTFLYRLERIRKILESELTDYEELLYLMISFYLLEEDQAMEDTV